LTFLVATVCYPALLALLAAGAALLADRLAGGRIPGPLLPAVGLAGLIVVSQITIAALHTAPLTPWALVLVAAAGLVLGRRRLRSLASAARREPLPLLAGVTVYVLACAPVLFAGRATLAGYLLDTSTAVHLAGADRLISHGLDFSGLPTSGYEGYLKGYFGTRYPSGGHTLLGGTGRIIGANLMWLYQPFMSAVLAFCAPSLWYLARSVAVGRRLAFAGAVIASIPALVYAYTLMGAIKEITLLPLILVTAGLLVAYRRWLGAGIGGGVPLALVGAAGLATVGLAFGPWLALALAIVAVLAIAELRGGRLGARPLALQVVVAGAIFAACSIGTLAHLGASASLAGSLSTSNVAAVSDPGNLLRPLKSLQTMGIWLHGSHRVDPPNFLTQTYVLIGAALVAALFGFFFIARRRAWILTSYVVGTALIWWLLAKRGPTWTDAKLLVLVSPLALLLVVAGIQSLRSAGRRVEAAALLIAVFGSVLWSDALIYHDTNLAPTARFEELASVGKRFAGQGPTLATDFDEYALYLGRGLDVSSPGFARGRDALGLLKDGRPAGYGQSYDLDSLALHTIDGYPLLLVRRSPEQSLAPSGFVRAFSGRWYEVWRRTPAAREVIGHVGAGGDAEATAKPRCSSVRRLASRTRSLGGTLRYVLRPESVVVDPRKAALTSQFGVGPEGIGMAGAGRLDTTVPFARGGRYRVWLKGDIGRRVEIMVDDRILGSVAGESGGQGNYTSPVDAVIAAGRRRIAVRRGGGSLRPGDGSPSRILRIVFAPLDGAPRVVDVAPSDWRSICDMKVDWVEGIRPPA
jgi:hypothetical protein